jgi:hypothetical protein
MKTLAIAATLLFLVGCEEEKLFPNSPSPTTSVAIPSAELPSPTPPALPQEPPATSGPRSASCVNGWTSPDPGSSLAAKPLRILRRTTRVPDEPVVVELRYFTGPESPPSDKGYISTVERWYVKLYAEADLTFQGRFLVESREFGDGVAAVAPYDTEGFRSPDWSGFQWELGSRPEAHPGLPGTWQGTRYDFVEGGSGLDLPGLPDAVSGCLEGS